MDLCSITSRKEEELMKKMQLQFSGKSYLAFQYIVFYLGIAPQQHYSSRFETSKYSHS
jgi:hypothetical protein